MRSRYNFTDPNAVHFLTCTTVEWIPVFTTEPLCRVVLDSLTFCREEKQLRLYAYVIMENHLHLIAEAPDLSAVVQAFKGYTAREIIRVAEQTGRMWLLAQFMYSKKGFKTNSRHQVWQEGSHPKLIQNEDMLNQKIDYIHANPVRRGWVDLPEHWRYSSARNFAGISPVALEIDDLPR